MFVWNQEPEVEQFRDWRLHDVDIVILVLIHWCLYSFSVASWYGHWSNHLHTIYFMCWLWKMSSIWRFFGVDTFTSRWRQPKRFHLRPSQLQLRHWIGMVSVGDAAWSFVVQDVRFAANNMRQPRNPFLFAGQGMTWWWLDTAAAKSEKSYNRTQTAHV